MDKELTTQEFMAELAKYPKVRGNNYKGTVETQQTKQQKPTTTKLAYESKNTNSSTPLTIPPATSSKDFWGAFKGFLTTNFSKDEADKIFVMFQTTHNQYVKSLSLDSIERLASQISALTVSMNVD